MRTQFRLLFILFSIGLLVSVALAQVDQSKARRQAALDALRQLSGSLQDIDDECLKTDAQVQLADLLWAHDEMQAKHLFEDAFRLAFTFPMALGHGSCSAQSWGVAGMKILQCIAMHDADWAAQLIESLPDDLSFSGQKGGIKGQSVKMRLQQSLAIRQRQVKGEEGRTEVSSTNGSERIRAMLFGRAATETLANKEASSLIPLNVLNSSTPQKNSTDSMLGATPTLFSGDFDRAMDLGGKLGGASIRAQLGSLIRFEELNAAISASTVEQALSHIQSLPSLSRRATAFINLANVRRSTKGAVGALEILLLARQSLEADKDGLEKAEALASLAEAMVELDSERSFELMQSAITTLNAAEQEIIQGGQDNLSVGIALGKLAQLDFTRAWTLTVGINHRVLAWYTKFALCRGSLITT